MWLTKCYQEFGHVPMSADIYFYLSNAQRKRGYRKRGRDTER